MAFPIRLSPGQGVAPLAVHSQVAAAMMRLSPVSLPGSWTPDPLGPVSPVARQVKGQMELSANGGADSGSVGMAPNAGPGSWSDDRMPFARGHFIPYAMGGLMSGQLGDLGIGGVGGIPEPKRAWIGAQATHPMAGLNKPDYSDQLAGMRYPISMGVSYRQYSLPEQIGGPYNPNTGDVLPPLATDPYASLPDYLQASLVGPAGRTW